MNVVIRYLIKLSYLKIPFGRLPASRNIFVCGYVRMMKMLISPLFEWFKIQNMNERPIKSFDIRVYMFDAFINIVKLREREGQRVDLGRSLKVHLWMVDGGWWYTFP